jgi:hypothetical protein
MKEKLTGFQDIRLELSDEQVDLVIRLGAITVAQKVLPEIFDGAVYEETLDKLRFVTEERIA